MWLCFRVVCINASVHDNKGFLPRQLFELGAEKAELELGAEKAKGNVENGRRSLQEAIYDRPSLQTQ